MTASMTDFATHRESFYAALVALSEFIRLDERLSSGLDKGRLDFYGTADPKLLADSDGNALDAARSARFLEWFSLERPYGDGQAAPVHAFVSSGCPGVPSGVQAHGRCLADGRAGVFLVKDLDDTGMDLEDAVSGDRLSVLTPNGESLVESGDTLLGRLLPVPASDQWLASDAIERMEGSSIFDACVEDVERSKLDLGREELEPIGQLDLEVLLNLARGSEADADTSTEIGSLEESLSDLLRDAPVQVPNCEDVCETLAQSPTAGLVLDPLLESLAFHTDVPIDTARRLILELWTAYHARESAQDKAGEPLEGIDRVLDATGPDEAALDAIPVAQLGEHLLREIEAGEAKGEGAENLFGRLERMLEGENSGSNQEGPPESIDWRTADAGNLDALLTEYLWERNQMGRQVDQETAKRLQEFTTSLKAAKILEIENVDDLCLARTVVQSWARGDIQAVQDLMCDLVEWEQWIIDVQEIAFGTSMTRLRDALIEDGARLAQISEEMSSTAMAEDPGTSRATIQSWHVLKDPEAGWILESPVGRQAWLQQSDFVVGDLILGAFGENGFLPGFRLIPRVLAQALATPEDDS